MRVDGLKTAFVFSDFIYLHKNRKTTRRTNNGTKINNLEELKPKPFLVSRLFFKWAVKVCQIVWGYAWGGGGSEPPSHGKTVYVANGLYYKFIRFQLIVRTIGLHVKF